GLLPNIGAYEATLAQFLVELDPWSPVYTNNPFNVTVTAADPYGKTVYVYRGTIHFETTDPDPRVSIPGDYAYQASDAGKHTFAALFVWLVGPRGIPGRDVSHPTFAGPLAREAR